MSAQVTKEVEFMTLPELSIESLQLKESLKENPDDFELNSRLKEVSIERKKKKLQNLLKDLELGGPNFFHVKPEIETLRDELTILGVNISMLEMNFLRQSLYI